LVYNVFMVKDKRMLAVYKITCGLLGLMAIVTEVVTLTARGTFVPVNFFSFFTVESNIFAAVILIASGVLIGRKKQPSIVTMLRGASTLYMVTTGIVFSVLLSGLEANLLTAVPWDNIVLHYIMPVAVLVDWLVDPPRNRIRFKQAIVWLLYPIAYVIYSLVRGAMVGWYPYPFLNPAINGWTGIGLTTIGITLTVLFIMWVLLKISRRGLK
jgi:hypothetical protein